MALTCSVLKRGRAVFVQYAPDDLHDVVGCQGLDVGHATGEGDDVGPGCDGEERPHLGGRHL